MGAATAIKRLYSGDGTGLYYSRARYYRPDCMRFISEDPIGWASGQVNDYAYVAGNPVQFKDPYGLYADIVAGAAGAYSAFAGGCAAGARYASLERSRDHFRGDPNIDGATPNPVADRAKALENAIGEFGPLVLRQWKSIGATGLIGVRGGPAGVLGGIFLGTVVSAAGVYKGYYDGNCPPEISIKFGR